jgi:hypothetical protein
MSAKDPLQRLAVTSPCTQDWDSMIGNDRVRFCDHCSLHVHNISAMTRAEAFRLAHRSQGRLCVRYHSTTQNPIVTRTPESRRLYQIGRRVSRLASGAFSATLSVSAAFAEPAPNIHRDTSVVSQVIEQRTLVANGGSITGTVMDQNQAVIPGAAIVLTTAQTQSELTGTTNDTGVFRFDGLGPGYYSLKVSSPGFVTFERKALHVDGAQDVDVQVAMIVEVTAMAGAVAVMSPGNPFVKAAHDDDLDALRALIADADVNFRDPDTGTTALDHAVQNGNQEMVQFLIARGADVNASQEDGHSALMQLGDDATPDLLWDLINAGAKINHKNSYGTTALMTVASQNNSEIVEELLAAGAEVNAADEDGKTALMMAASEGLVLNVRLLVLAGAKIDARDSEGKNALMHAIENEHRVVIRFLRSKGAVEVPLKKDKEDEEEEDEKN